MLHYKIFFNGFENYIIIIFNLIFSVEGKGDAPSKIKAMQQAGVTMSPSPAQIGKTMLKVMQERKLA